MDFGFAVKKMKQGERVFRKRDPSRVYGIARSGDDQMIAEFTSYGSMSTGVLTQKDIFAEDWELFVGWKND